MKIEDIEKMWDEDSTYGVDMTEETQKTPKLHNKYYKIYMREALKLEKVKNDLDHLKRLKKEYYDDKMSDDERNELGWEPLNLRILKADISTYVNDDEHVKNKTMELHLLKAKVVFLENIIKQIKERGFQIRAMIDWEKFKTGA